MCFINMISFNAFIFKLLYLVIYAYEDLSLGNSKVTLEAQSQVPGLPDADVSASHSRHASLPQRCSDPRHTVAECLLLYSRPVVRKKSPETSSKSSA